MSRADIPHPSPEHEAASDEGAPSDALYGADSSTDRDALALVTPRLCLAVVTLAQAAASADGDLPALAVAMGVRVPPDWPPPDTADAKPGFRDAIAAHPDAYGWWGGFHIILTSPERLDGDEPILIGGIGVKGPPGPDGAVEMGYSIVPAFHRRGYATEAARALVAWCFFHAEVDEVAAEAFPQNVASLAVMRRCGMVPCGPGLEPGTVRYSVTRNHFRTIPASTSA